MNYVHCKFVDYLKRDIQTIPFRYCCISANTWNLTKYRHEISFLGLLYIFLYISVWINPRRTITRSTQDIHNYLWPPQSTLLAHAERSWKLRSCPVPLLLSLCTPSLLSFSPSVSAGEALSLSRSLFKTSGSRIIQCFFSQALLPPSLCLALYSCAPDLSTFTLIAFRFSHRYDKFQCPPATH